MRNTEKFARADVAYDHLLAVRSGLDHANMPVEQQEERMRLALLFEDGRILCEAQRPRVHQDMVEAFRVHCLKLRQSGDQRMVELAQWFLAGKTF